jgi:hypothetical protein
VPKRNPPATNIRPGPTESAGVGRPANGRMPAVVDVVGGEFARQRTVHPDEPPPQSRQYETEPPPGPRRRPDPVSSPLKVELALLRAFLGDEIDAILCDKD